MRKVLFIIAGWLLLVAGFLIMPLPFPLPFPVGMVLALVGSAILTMHSKPFRRWLQRARHSYGWLDRAILLFSRRSPKSVQEMVERTDPLAVDRYLRLHTYATDHHPCGAAE